MWGNKSKSHNVDTLIAEGTSIKGDLTFEGALFVDGVIEGDIHGTNHEKSVLSVGVHGRIEGNIESPYVIIFGQVDGDVRVSQKVELKPGAKVNGDLYYKVMEMNAGATVNGKMVNLGEPHALEHKPDHSEVVSKPKVSKESSDEEKSENSMHSDDNEAVRA
ncbi:bactofilin family protein [Kangiella aquimarina]|uniref:Polymer-forming cytoskeletal protein n=1 Tax=Kangiella aquimarina TaxID=261965 RepID=A0ABZ0X4J6_9GAMM|nr:polymer-forming cytoskeletal protein [Kangiella aquimarina]WQG85289.1 polymer-forming cytoskeletal protein [Kangiella aquimarina]